VVTFSPLSRKPSEERERKTRRNQCCALIDFSIQQSFDFRIAARILLSEQWGSQCRNVQRFTFASVLRQIAERRGWEVIEQYSDAGISGSKGRDGRPGLDQMLNDAKRGKFELVMAWAIDRLGRSLVDLLHTIQELEAAGVDLYLDQQSIDTTTPMGKLMFQVTGAFAEFERGMIRQRVHAGLKRAVEAGKTLGRPRISAALEKRIQDRLRAGMGIIKVAREVGVGNGTVQRIAQELRGPFVAA
jgi:DNA invertase Pin-like site-specific DNA recombinase